MKPKRAGLSIIIPTYQRIAALLDCIESILQNTGRHLYEIIIVDDNDDRTISTHIEKHLPTTAKIKYFRNRKRRGPAYSRNKGLKQAKYRYIAFLDDDCLVPPSWITDILSFFEKDKKENVVGVRGKTITTSTSSFTQAHVLYETFWLHILHADANGNKNIFHKFIASLRKKTFTKCIVDFAPSNNFSIDRTELDISFNTQYRTSAGEDVDLCNTIQKSKKYIAYTDAITVIHNHHFAGKKEFKRKFVSYGKHLGVQSSTIKKLANIILNPLLISIYFRTPTYYFLFLTIEKSINFPKEN